MHSLPDVRYLWNESRLLQGNPWGDPHVRRLPVYVPPGYDEDRDPPYPVAFLLSGWGGRGARYLADEGAFLTSLPDRLDRAIESGELPPILIALPDCTTKLGASQYVNSPANGPYMDYLCDELVPLLDEKFNTHRNSDYRILLGHSSGGFGALVTGMIRPDVFHWLVSSAGDSAYEHIYLASIPMMVRVLRESGGVKKFVEDFLSSPNPMGLKSREACETMMNLSMCPCYAPNLSEPTLKGDLYFDLETGEKVPEVWNQFLAWDPIQMAGRYATALNKLRWILLEAGTEDEYALHLGHRQLAQRLAQHKISHELVEYPGKHGGHHYRIVSRLQRVLQKMYGSANSAS